MTYEKRLIWVLGIAFGVVFFDRNAVTNLMPFIIDDLKFSNQQAGMIVSALSFTWATIGFLGAAYSDRSGNRKGLLVVAYIAFSLCSFLSGLAGSFMLLLLARLLMGTAEGPILPVAQSLLAAESPEAKRGHNMGVMQNFGSNLLGSFLCPLVLVAVASAYGWRVAFFVAGIPGLLMALLIARYVRSPAPAPVATATSHEALRYGELLQHRNIVLCILMAIVMVAWMVLGWAFLPLLYVKVRLLSASQMSHLMSVLGLSAAFFSFVVPSLSDRFGRRPVIVVFHLIGLLTPLAALYFQGSLFMLGSLIFIGWSASGTFPLFMATIPAETIPARYLATTVGLVMGIGEVLGGVSSPWIAGWAADQYGLQATMVIMAGCAVAGTILALFLRETAPVRLSRRQLAPMSA
ncbi:MAG TPA: MFS transporter [Steroidobacteraceae bacterium]|jgi:predicted MFS family arabinose efflux permease